MSSRWSLVKIPVIWKQEGAGNSLFIVTGTVSCLFQIDLNSGICQGQSLCIQIMSNGRSPDGISGRLCPFLFLHSDPFVFRTNCCSHKTDIIETLTSPSCQLSECKANWVQSSTRGSKESSGCHLDGWSSSCHQTHWADEAISLARGHNLWQVATPTQETQMAYSFWVSGYSFCRPRKDDRLSQPTWCYVIGTTGAQTRGPNILSQTT